MAWNVEKTLFDYRSTVAWPSTTVAWPFSDFFHIFLYCLNVEKTLFDSRPTVAWPPPTAAWPFSDFFQKNSESLETSKKRCLTVGQRSRDLRPLSRDRSATFFKIFKNFLNVEKTLFLSRPTVAWPTTTVAWPFSYFFLKFSELLETSKKRCLTVGRQSRDPRPLSRDCSATFFKMFPNCLKRQKSCLTVGQRSRDLRPLSRVVQRLFSKKFWIAWNVEKKLFDCRPTVAWPPTTVAWPFSDFFQNRSTDFFPRFLRTTSHTLAYVVFLVLIILSFRRTAWPRISSYRNGSILEILTSYQS